MDVADEVTATLICACARAAVQALADQAFTDHGLADQVLANSEAN
jgi:hypothetical protein